MKKVIELINKGSKHLKNEKIMSHRLDSEVLLSKVLKKTREEMLINLNENLSIKIENQFYKLLKRRKTKEPIAYIFNEKEFWNHSFFVNKNTLIPRPETELLVEEIVKIYKSKAIKILDIGTGSGCILLSILTEIKRAKGIGVDISQKAIKLAKKNAKKLKLTNRAKFLNN